MDGRGILYKLVCTIVIVILLRSSVSGSRRVRHHRSTNHQLELEFIANQDKVRGETWKCSVPKARLAYVDEAVGTPGLHTPDTIWLVDSTVLHRCDPMFGCCTWPNKCVSTSEQNVTVTFKKYNMLTSTESYVRLTFVNHTSCSCSP